MSRRKKPQNRNAEGPKGGAQAEPQPERRQDGTFAPGTSGNPGGIPAKALELRKLALESSEKALKLAISWLDNKDPAIQEMGVRHVLNRALGKDGTVRDLPVDAPPLSDVDTSPAGLLALATKALGHVLAHWTARAAAGQLADGDVERLADAARTLQVLAREEREQNKGGDDTSGLSDAELLARLMPALERLPLPGLEALVAKRKATPPQEPA